MCISQYDGVSVLGEGDRFEGKPFGECESINVE